MPNQHLSIKSEQSNILIGAVIGGSLFTGYFLYKWYRTKRYREKLSLKVKAHLQRREKEIEQICKITADLDPELEKQIASMGVRDLLKALKAREVSCSNVLKVYQKRSLYSQELTNCITDYILEANKVAEEYDLYLSENPDYETPPLFGLPISVKSNIPFKGRDMFSGCVQDLGCPVESDSVIVQHLQDLGAIPFVLTNVPQTLFSFSCENPVYGSTNNPLSKERTSGGSSGGEGALIGSGGSLVGIGSDMGGSIRIPAAFCGIVGFKPCSRRSSNAGIPGTAPGCTHVFGSSGPLSVNVEGCVEVLRAFWSKKWIHNWDAYIAPLDFQEEMYQSTAKLRIGYFDSIDCIQPVPVMKRAVHETCKSLEQNGHELVKFDPPNATRAYQLFVMAIMLDNGQWIINKWDKDLPVEGYDRMMMPYRWPFWFRRALAFVLRHSNRRIADAIGTFHSTTKELLAVYREIEAYWITWKKEMKKKKIDCFICPSFPVPAMKHKEPYKTTFNCSYTSLFNLIDYPAGTLPVTKVNEQDIADLNQYKPVDFVERILQDSAKGTLGYPVSVQVVSLPYHDETALRLMKEIEESVQKNPVV